MTDDEPVPVSVRLGEVVPPEDPEDWTRPLTWVAALGMLAGPMVTFAWFVLAAPVQSSHAVPATFLAAAAVAGGAALTGATQIGVARAWTGTVGAGLFSALAVILLGVVMAGERQVGIASPTLAHAFAAAVGGIAGAGAAAVIAMVAAHLGRRPARLAIGLAGGVVASLAIVRALLP